MHGIGTCGVSPWRKLCNGAGGTLVLLSPLFKLQASNSTLSWWRPYKGAALKIKIEKTKCAGHNRCYSGYPELFCLDEDGESYALNDGVVPQEFEEDVDHAIKDCPEKAIVIISE